MIGDVFVSKMFGIIIFFSYFFYLSLHVFIFSENLLSFKNCLIQNIENVHTHTFEEATHSSKITTHVCLVTKINNKIVIHKIIIYINYEKNHDISGFDKFIHASVLNKNYVKV